MDTAQRLADLAEADRIIELDFPVRPEIRFGWDKPPHAELLRAIAASDKRYASTLRSFVRYARHLHRIAPTADSPKQPSWINDMIPAADAVSIYGYVAKRKPNLYIEIGSGNAAKFARRAISDHKLRTRIICVDPSPRSECDEICDEVIRAPLEKADLTVFSKLTARDVVFCDNSHRSFQNSDVTVFFMEVLPRLSRHVLVGLHDIFLPHDYPSHWKSRFYNEQYLLASYILGGANIRVELPMFHCLKSASMAAVLEPIWSSPNLQEALKVGGAFWLSRR